jgi:hypothetical protein
VISVFGLILAVLAFGGDRFDGGVQVTSSSIEYLQKADNQAKLNSEALENISAAIAKRDAQIDTLLGVLSKNNSLTSQ